MDEWLLCSVLHHIPPRISAADSCRRSVPRYGTDGHPKGRSSRLWKHRGAGRRLATLETKVAQTQAQQENISGQ